MTEEQKQCTVNEWGLGGGGKAPAVKRMGPSCKENGKPDNCRVQDFKNLVGYFIRSASNLIFLFIIWLYLSFTLQTTRGKGWCHAIYCSMGSLYKIGRPSTPFAQTGWAKFGQGQLSRLSHSLSYWKAGCQVHEVKLRLLFSREMMKRNGD